MSESYADFITKTLDIELETWQHDLIAFYAQRYSHDASLNLETPELKAAEDPWYIDLTPQGYKTSNVQGEPLEFNVVDEILEQHRRWRYPTDEEKAEDARREEARTERMRAIFEGREPTLYAHQPPSKPLWEKPRAPLNRAERRAAARQTQKEV